MLRRIARSPIGWAMTLVIVVLALASVCSIVPETSQALIVRMGQPERVVNGYRPGGMFGDDGAGLIAHIPLIEQVYFIDKRVHDIDLTRQPVLSTDQQRLEIDVFARYRIVDPLRMYLAARGDEKRVVEALKPSLGSALRNQLGGRTLAALLSPERGAVTGRMRDSLDLVAKQYGARIVDVRIAGTRLPDGAPLDSALARMRLAREQQAKTIQTEGMRQAAIVRAQADADASRTYADAFNKDADFYDFYRSMQSYRATFGTDGPTDGSTTFVLSPRSEYFRNFTGRGQ